MSIYSIGGLKRLQRLLFNEMNTFISGVLDNLGISLLKPWNDLKKTFLNNSALAASEDVESIIRIHDNYLEALKASFGIWNISAQKNKLGLLCNIMLKAETLLENTYSYYKAFLELDRRHRGETPFDDSIKEELLINARTHGPRLIQELMISVHSCARSFQAEFDDLLIVYNKHQASLYSDSFSDDIKILANYNYQDVTFLDLADWNEYQRRRVGFDEKKYKLVMS
jgi:hypothetical protein